MYAITLRFQKYLRHNLIALDQLGNALLGGFPDETISARLWRNKHKHHFIRTLSLIVDLFFELLTGEKDHCKNAYEWELKKGDLPNLYRIHNR